MTAVRLNVELHAPLLAVC